MVMAPAYRPAGAILLPAAGRGKWQGSIGAARRRVAGRDQASSGQKIPAG